MDCVKSVILSVSHRLASVYRQIPPLHFKVQFVCKSINHQNTLIIVGPSKAVALEEGVDVSQGLVEYPLSSGSAPLSHLSKMF